MYMPQASRHSSKHWSAGVRPTWVKRTSVPPSVAAMSNRISVPVHSFWSSMKLIQLSMHAPHDALARQQLLDPDPREVHAGDPVDELVVHLVRASREVLLPPATDVVDGAIDLVRVLLDGEAGGVALVGHGASPVVCLHDASGTVPERNLRDASGNGDNGRMLGNTYETQVCSIARALELVGERWTLLILRNALFAGSTRYRDFQRALGIATNVLQDRLDGLVEDGIMERRPTVGDRRA